MQGAFNDQRGLNLGESLSISSPDQYQKVFNKFFKIFNKTTQARLYNEQAGKRVQKYAETMAKYGYNLQIANNKIQKVYLRSFRDLFINIKNSHKSKDMATALRDFYDELNQDYKQARYWFQKKPDNKSLKSFKNQSIMLNEFGPSLIKAFAENVSIALANSNSVILESITPAITMTLQFLSTKLSGILIAHPGLNKIFVNFSLWMADQVGSIKRYWEGLNKVTKAGTVNRFIVNTWDLLPSKFTKIIGKTLKILWTVLLKTVGTALKVFFVGLGKAILVGLKGLLLIGKVIFSAVGAIVTGIIAIVVLAIDQIFNDGRITQAVGEFIYHAWDWFISIFTGEQTMRQMEARLKKQEQQRQERIKKAREQSTKALDELDQFLFKINMEKILQPITNAQQYTIVFNKLKNTQKQIKKLNKQWRDNIDQIYSLQLEDTKIPILKQRIMDIDSERKKLKQLQVKLSENVIKYEEELLQKKQKQSDYYKKLYQLRLKQIQDTISFEQTITKYSKEAFKLFGQDSSAFEIDKLKQKMQLISQQIYSGFDLTTEQKVNLRKSLMDASIQMGNIRINAIQKQANAIKKYSNAISNFVIQMWKKMTGFINRGVKAITVGSQEGIAFAASSAQKFSLKNISNKSLEQTRQNKINEIKNIQQQTGNNIIRILDELKNIRPEIKNNRIKAVRAL